MNNHLYMALHRFQKRKQAVPRLLQIIRLREAIRAIHGPPPTEEELREAAEAIDKQRRRDLQG